SDCHAHWVLGAAVLLAFVWGCRRTLRRPEVAACVACFAGTWLTLSMGFREYALARFVATALPALWIVAAAGLVDVLDRTTWRTWYVTAGGALLAILVAVQLVRLPHLLESEYEVGTEFAPVFDFLAETLPPRSSVLVVGYTDHTSARMLEWE